VRQAWVVAAGEICAQNQANSDWKKVAGSHTIYFQNRSCDTPEYEAKDPFTEGLVFRAGRTQDYACLHGPENQSNTGAARKASLQLQVSNPSPAGQSNPQF
jgi:hypothetical protein